MATIDKIFKIFRVMLPKARLCDMPKDSTMIKLFKAISRSFSDAFDDIESLKVQVSPYNDNFSDDDISYWERRLWIPEKSDTTDNARRLLIIKRKMAQPGGIKGRNSLEYMQWILRESGFDVVVKENFFSDGNGEWESKSPVYANVTIFMSDGDGGSDQDYMDDRTTVEGNDSYMGRVGTVGTVQVVANTIVPTDGDNQIELPLSTKELKYTFFITGATGGLDEADAVEIPYDREVEFRYIIMRFKPANTMAFLNVVYTGAPSTSTFITGGGINLTGNGSYLIGV